MQIRTVAYNDFFNATIVLPEMVVQLAAGLGCTPEYIAKLQAQKLAKASGGKGGRSNGAGDLPDGKLRTVVLQKLQQPNDIVSGFAQGCSFEYEFHGEMFPDEKPAPDINAAGQNNRKQRAPRGNGAAQQGAYKVVNRNGLKCTAESDPEKFALWQFIFNCNTFEQYYAQAPKKAVTRTNRIITAASEMGWAIKCGWIVPVSNEQ
jgi:hypothetical protein